jgi:hypothetical protein
VTARSGIHEQVRGGTMGSPTSTGYRGIVDAVCDLAGVAA